MTTRTWSRSALELFGIVFALAALMQTGCAASDPGFYNSGMRLDREGCGVREYGWWDRSPRRCSWYENYSRSAGDERVLHDVVDFPG